MLALLQIMLAVRGLARLAPVQVAARSEFDAPFPLLESLLDIYKCLNILFEEENYLSSSRAQHTLPDLPYDYNALEPVKMILR